MLLKRFATLKSKTGFPSMSIAILKFGKSGMGMALKTFSLSSSGITRESYSSTKFMLCFQVGGLHQCLCVRESILQALEHLCNLYHANSKDEFELKQEGDIITGTSTIINSNGEYADMKLEEPEPADGWDNYDTYLANNLEIPDELKTKPASGGTEVEVSFEVNKNGEPVNIKVEKSLCGKCDKEAIRLVKEGPKWRRNANKKGRTTVTIRF